MRKQLLAACEAIAMAQPKRAPDYTSCGKEVLRDGEHFADAASPDIAAALADVLNGQVLLNVAPERADEIAGVLWS